MSSVRNLALNTAGVLTAAFFAPLLARAVHNKVDVLSPGAAAESALWYTLLAVASTWVAGLAAGGPFASSFSTQIQILAALLSLYDALYIYFAQEAAKSWTSISLFGYISSTLPRNPFDKITDSPPHDRRAVVPSQKEPPVAGREDFARESDAAF